MTQIAMPQRTLSVRACAGMEAVLLLMVAAAPWMFGSVHPLSELLLIVGLACILVLWNLRLALDGGPLWAPCGVGIGLALICVLGIWQLTPLPSDLLRAISPGTAQIYDQMLPSVPEKVRGVVYEGAPVPTTLSVAPFATKDAVFRLIAILALFAAVRSNLTSPLTMYRLAIVAVLNGVLLSILGIAQFFTSPHNILFWTFTSDGGVFGPFICRNHFAYLINLTMGLGFGLLLCANDAKSNTRSSASSLQGLLHRPALLWVASALTMMGAGLVCSMSRGGVVAFLSAGIVCLLIKLWHSGWTIRFRAGFFLAALALAFIAWLTSDFAGKRFATLLRSDILDEGRGPVWTRTLGLIKRFPIFGTGFGTFRFVEPMTRLPSDGSDVIHEHLHNDFLEVFIEGGIVQFAMGAVVVVLLLVAGIRAHARLRGRWEGNLVLGALFGLMAVLIHGIVDFGMHIPAVALLTTVVAALMLNFGDAASSTTLAEDRRDLRPNNRWSAACGIFALAGVAFFLVDTAWRSEHAERFRLAAERVADDEADGPAKRIAYLEAALAYTPGDSLLHVATAEAYRELYLVKQDRWRLALTTQLICKGGGLVGYSGNLSSAAILGNAPVPQDDDLATALKHQLAARAACPLNLDPHLFLAAYNDVLSSADPPAKYLERACLLDPANSRSWYVAGLHELDAGNDARVWECWRRSLQCNTTYLAPILNTAAKSLSTAELLDNVLPESPGLLLDAAKYLQKKNADDPATERILDRALDLLDRNAPQRDDSLVMKARVEARLNRFSAARASYERAVAREPSNSALRLEFSELLIRAGQLSDARKELVTILSLQPDNQNAKSAYDAVIRRIAETGP